MSFSLQTAFLHGYLSQFQALRRNAPLPGNHQPSGETGGVGI